MAKPSLNFKNLTFLIADANSVTSTICRSILRGFGTTRAMETRSADDTIATLHDAKVDLLLCDANLPPASGFALVEKIRGNPNYPFRTIPIVILMNETTHERIARARDCGANMVIAKPFSPATLHSRLAWVALTPRNFVDSPKYFGPDRRFKTEGFPDGQGRRAGDADSPAVTKQDTSKPQSDLATPVAPVKG